jgi:hypothetical protein
LVDVPLKDGTLAPKFGGSDVQNWKFLNQIEELDEILNFLAAVVVCED